MSTPIDTVILKQHLQNHEPNFVKYLIDGLNYGFHTGIHPLPEKTLECKNLLSATSQPEITFKLIQSKVDKGFLIGALVSMSFEIYRVNPIGTAEGKYSKKKRLIVDLSAPYNDENNKCLNQLIEKEGFSLNYVTIDHAIKTIKQSGTRSWLCKTDISDAFKMLTIHPTLWPFHAIK